MPNCGQGRAGRFWTNKLIFLKCVELSCHSVRKWRVGGCKRIDDVLKFCA